MENQLRGRYGKEHRQQRTREKSLLFGIRQRLQNQTKVASLGAGADAGAFVERIGDALTRQGGGDETRFAASEHQDADVPGGQWPASAGVLNDERRGPAVAAKQAICF